MPERTINVHVRSIRRKRGESADRFQTFRGLGHGFRDPNSTGEDPSEAEVAEHVSPWEERFGPRSVASVHTVVGNALVKLGRPWRICLQ